MTFDFSWPKMTFEASRNILEPQHILKVLSKLKSSLEIDLIKRFRFNFKTLF